MASQPIPAIGSLTFLIHLSLMGFDMLKKASKPKLISIVAVSVIVSASAYLIYTHYDKQTHHVRHAIAASRHLKEKTEPIKDTSFVKNLRFAAWLPWWDDSRVIASLSSLPDGNITVISPTWYSLGNNGALTPQGTALTRSRITQIAAEKHLAIIPTLTNEDATGFNAQRVTFLLQHPRPQQAFITQAITLAQRNGFKGYDLDWEQMNNIDKQAFSQFIQTVAEQFHQYNLLLLVSVQAKTDTLDDSGQANAEDWQAIGKYADQVRVMAYDFHSEESDPGAVTPLDDLEAVLEYATKTIPKEKISLGIPLYGYDWNGQSGKAMLHEEAVSIIKQNNGTITRDSSSSELIGQYGTFINPHIVWFLDQTSVLRILYIADNYGIKNVAFWRLGCEDQKVWVLKK